MKNLGRIAAILLVSLLIVGAAWTAVDKLSSSASASSLLSGFADDNYDSELGEHDDTDDPSESAGDEDDDSDGEEHEDDDEDQDVRDGEHEGKVGLGRVDDDDYGQGFGLLGIGKNLILPVALVALIVLAIRFWPALRQSFSVGGDEKSE